MSPEQEERFVVALELAVGALASIAKTVELDYARKYPPRKEPTEPTITYVKSPEEELREDLGDTGEKTTEDWLTLGPRERAFVEEEDRRKNGKARTAVKDDTRQT